MQHFIISLFTKLRYLAAGMYVLICLFMLSLLISAITGNSSAQAASNSSGSLGLAADGPNAVSNGMAVALDGTDSAVTAVNTAISTSSRSLASAATHSGSNISKAATAVVTGTFHGVAAAVHGIGHGFGAVFSGVGHGFGSAGRSISSGLAYSVRAQGEFGTSIARTAAMKPASKPADHEPVAVMSPASPALAKAKTALSTVPPAAPAAPLSIWPLHGTITTEFGQPEPPYQPIHTGIDISDGAPAGVSPVKAFRAGTVVDIEHSGGLGNHVIIDHGNGVTSVYGHLYSIAVSVGQKVDTATTIGLEGTTGVSTGPHVHFEIRVNNQVVNPHQFIAGQP